LPWYVTTAIGDDVKENVSTSIGFIKQTKLEFNIRIKGIQKLLIKRGADDWLFFLKFIFSTYQWSFIQKETERPTLAFFLFHT